MNIILGQISAHIMGFFSLPHEKTEGTDLKRSKVDAVDLIEAIGTH